MVRRSHFAVPGVTTKRPTIVAMNEHRVERSLDLAAVISRVTDFNSRLVLAANNLFRMIAMTSAEHRPPPAVGAYWINEADYPALQKLFTDGNRLPRTWKEWLKIAEEMEQGLKAYGHVVMRVRIDPNTFPNWCAAHGTSPSGEGRKRFVAEAVAERYGNQN
jgi:hypothetical protein